MNEAWIWMKIARWILLHTATIDVNAVNQQWCKKKKKSVNRGSRRNLFRCLFYKLHSRLFITYKSLLHTFNIVNSRDIPPRSILVSIISLSSFVFRAWDPSDNTDKKCFDFTISVHFSKMASFIDKIKFRAVRWSCFPEIN